MSTTMRDVLNSRLLEPLVYVAFLLADFMSQPVSASSRTELVCPDNILRDIISRLPVKDAACTALLLLHWLMLWRSTPLILIDASTSRALAMMGA
jgi:hypothetical protein